METSRTYYRVDRKEIGFLRFIIEAYDGLALLRTVDPIRGVVALHTAPGSEAETAQLMGEMGARIRIEPCPPPVDDLHWPAR